MISYNIFDENLTENLISKYNDGCMHIFYKDNVVLFIQTGMKVRLYIIY